MSTKGGLPFGAKCRAHLRAPKTKGKSRTREILYQMEIHLRFGDYPVDAATIVSHMLIVNLAIFCFAIVIMVYANNTRTPHTQLDSL